MTRRIAYNAKRGKLLGDCLRAIGLLRQRAWEVDDLADTLGLKRRTMYRILQALRESGIPTTQEREGLRHGYIGRHRIRARDLRAAMGV